MDAMAHVGWDLVTGGQTPSDFRIIALWWAILPLPGLGLVIVPPEVTFRWLKLPTGQLQRKLSLRPSQGHLHLDGDDPEYQSCFSASAAPAEQQQQSESR